MYFAPLPPPSIAAIGMSFGDDGVIPTPRSVKGADNLGNLYDRPTDRHIVLSICHIARRLYMLCDNDIVTNRREGRHISNWIRNAPITALVRNTTPCLCTYCSILTATSPRNGESGRFELAKIEIPLNATRLAHDDQNNVRWDILKFIFGIHRRRSNATKNYPGMLIVWAMSSLFRFKVI